MSAGRNNAPDFTYSSSTPFANATSGSIPDNTGASLTRTFTAPGISTPIARITVSNFKITHAHAGDLLVTLTRPFGTIDTLTANNGGTGGNYSTTIFDDEGSTSITVGTAPFSATFVAQNPLAAFAGTTANGTWTLTVTDNITGTAGTFTSATLNVYGKTSGAYTYIGETSVPIVSGETAYVNGYYSSKVSGTVLALKVTRSL